MRGARAVHERILQANPDAALDVLLVWSPILTSDSREAAEKLAASIDDPRARFFWDADMAVGKALAPLLGITQPDFAWDVYCLFDAKAKWSEAIPEPAHWGHQLSGADPAHSIAAKLETSLEAWTQGMLGSPAAPCSTPADPTAKVLTFRPGDVKPLPEVLLDGILDDLQADTKALPKGIDPQALEQLAKELRRRMAEATVELGDGVPKAVRHEGKVLVIRQR